MGLLCAGSGHTPPVLGMPALHPMSVVKPTPSAVAITLPSLAGAAQPIQPMMGCEGLEDEWLQDHNCGIARSAIVNMASNASVMII
jgi:hypothetical protein